MNAQPAFAATFPHIPAYATRAEHPALTTETLPFTVRLVKTEEDLWKAVQIRHLAYGRHVPQFAETLRVPEGTDMERGVVVLLAESKLDGSPLGTMRIQTNRFRPLTLEQSIELPEWLQNTTLAEATRLGITEDRVGRMVKTALFKAFYQYCSETGIEWMVIAGRSPIDRQYERLLFKDIYPGMGFIPLQHADNMPHRIMALKVSEVRPLWHAATHPLFNFFFHTFHPDIRTEERAPAAPTPVRPAVSRRKELAGVVQM